MRDKDADFQALADFMEWVDPEGYAQVFEDDA